MCVLTVGCGLVKLEHTNDDNDDNDNNNTMLRIWLLLKHSGVFETLSLCGVMRGLAADGVTGGVFVRVQQSGLCGSAQPFVH